MSVMEDRKPREHEWWMGDAYRYKPEGYVMHLDLLCAIEAASHGISTEVRPLRLLMRHNIRTVDELHDLGYDEVKKWRQVGKKVLKIFAIALEAEGKPWQKQCHCCGNIVNVRWPGKDLTPPP